MASVIEYATKLHRKLTTGIPEQQVNWTLDKRSSQHEKRNNNRPNKNDYQLSGLIHYVVYLLTKTSGDTAPAECRSKYPRSTS